MVRGTEKWMEGEREGVDGRIGWSLGVGKETRGRQRRDGWKE